MISIPPATRSFYFQSVQKVPEQPFPAHYHNWFEFYYIICKSIVIVILIIVGKAIFIGVIYIHI